MNVTKEIKMSKSLMTLVTHILKPNSLKHSSELRARIPLEFDDMAGPE